MQAKFRQWHGFYLILAGLGGVAFSAFAGPGYLPSVGPMALRFSLPPTPFTNEFVLSVPAPIPEPEPVAPKSDKPIATNAAPVLPTHEPEVSTNQPPAAQDVVHPDEVVSPQMLLKFFNKSTNGSGTSIITPLEFTPPKSADPATSKATYSTGP